MSQTVLILDDSLTVRMDLAAAFEAAGFLTAPCATAAEARELLSRGPVDVIILDVVLPDGDGIDFLAEIHAAPSSSTAAVLMLSTEAEVKDRLRGLQAGADEYVGKPYNADYVVAKARELVRGRTTTATDVTAVLIIDDSATFREQLRTACEEAGYQVLTAENGDEGLRVAADRRPQAMIVDGVLPDMDGVTVIRRIRLDAALRRVPCLLLTASEDSGAELRALDAGADAFARKEDEAPVVLAKLGALLRRVTAATPGDETGSLLGPKRILAVDDSATYLHQLADLLRDEGYDVVLAGSGEEALDLVASQAMDCILLDLVMPGLGGQETCRQIKSAPVIRDVPLIMLTALEDREAMIAALGAGADDYIPKSTEFEVLTARVRAQMRRKQFEDENRSIREELLRREIEATEARAARELAETRAALVGELEHKNRELEAFSYSVSHDLRSPLLSIDGFSQILLEEHADQLDETAEDLLRRVRSAARRMGELIDDLLQLSRVGRAELNRDRVDLSAVAQAIVADLVKNDPTRRVTVRIEDGLMADADSRLITAALENLLGNAWKFTANVSEAVIELGADRSDGAPVYFVRDNGAGFEMAYVDKLFNPFQRLHGDSDFPGTGIGLATVRRIIDRHGGRVWAEGTVEQGATFYFTIPSISAVSGRDPLADAPGSRSVG
jgi:two-component system NtrC family sensor kinase